MKVGLHCFALMGLLGCAWPAAAQNTLAKDVADQAQTLDTPDHPRQPANPPPPPPSSEPDLVVAPIPVSNPAFGTGLAATAVLFYNPNRASQPWISGIGGGYTSTKSWGVGAFHSMSAAGDRVRVLAFAGYGEVNLNFYGIGPNAGSAGVSVDLHDKAFMGLADGEFKIFRKGFLRHLYLGARYLYLDINASVDLPSLPPDSPVQIPSQLQRESKISMIGPAFTFDSRDNSTNPRKGVYATGSKLYGVEWLGSDFTHNKLQFAGNAYFPLGTAVVGVRKQLCGASDDAPYYDLCMFGQQGDLRGYETGRYRDGASWAIQAEVRQHLFGRFGGAVFGGVGGIAENTKAIWKHSTVLASGGVGLRYLASKSSNVDLRADVAWGKDGPAFYFGIGEAF